jgi:hypothetical protein
MSAGARFKSLLAVQKQRVDRAMADVLEKNEALRQQELQREGAQERAHEAVVAYRLEQQRLAESVVSGVLAVRLTDASLRCEAQRTLIAETAQALVAAEDLLTAAEANAAGARATYRRTLARQDALLSLQASWRKTDAQRSVRLEEQDA